MLPITDLRRFLLLLLIGLSSCNSSNNKEVYTDDILRITVFPTKDNINYLYASEVISDIEYIPLETSIQCLIGEYFLTSISENFILVYSRPHCILFSRQGKYIRHIGSQGQGPEEYYIVSSMSIDEKSNMIYMVGMSELLAYRISGEFVKKFNLKEFSNKVGISGSFQKVFHWKDNLFCANINLYSGKEDYHFVIFSLNGQVIKLLHNFIKFERESNISYYNSMDDYADIYLYNGQLSYKHSTSDTLFRVNDQLEFVPEVIFDLCGRNVQADIRSKNDNDRSIYTSVYDIHELENYILFSCKFGNITPKGLPTLQTCLYNKKSNKLTILKCDLLGKKQQRIIPSMSGVLSNNNEQLVDYFSEPVINDIDGGYNFYIFPSQIAFFQDTHQLMCGRFQPYRLLKDLTEEHFTTKKIKNKEAHERLKNVLANLNGDDNPVLMIATFK